MLDSLINDRRFVTLTKLLQVESQIFNVFDVLQYSDYEIRHSNVIAWLLDPNGSHNTGNLFLESFCQETFGKESNVPPSLSSFAKAKDVEVIRESFHNLDILVVSRSTQTCLAIENKFGSLESDGQTLRYRKEVEKAYSGFSRFFVFLSPNGQQAQDDAWLAQNYWTILNLVSTAKDSTLDSRVKTFLEDYERLINKKLKLWNGHPAVLAREILENYPEVLKADPEELTNLSRAVRETIHFILTTSASNAGQVADMFEPILKDQGFRIAKRGHKFPSLWVNFHSEKLLKTIISVSPEQKRTEFTYSLLIDFEKTVFHLAVYGKKTHIIELLLKQFDDKHNHKVGRYKTFIKENVRKIGEFSGIDGKLDLAVARSYVNEIKGAIDTFETEFCDPLLGSVDSP